MRSADNRGRIWSLTSYAACLALVLLFGLYGAA